MACMTRLCNTRGDEIQANSAQTLNINSPSLDSTLKPLSEGRTFPLFSSLPKELRLQIWEEVTPRERVVQVSIGLHRDENNEVPEAPVRYLEKNHLGNPVSGSLYRLLHKDTRLEHPLLTVNREARQLVLNFYRIQMPAHCTFPRGSHPNWQQCDGLVKTLFINPEHDVLQISAEEPVSRTLIDFLWDLKAYDPRGVGLLKLATDLSAFCRNDLQFLKRSDLLLIRQRQVLIDTLSQLQEVWFIAMEPVKKGYVRSFGSPATPYPLGHKTVEFENVGGETRKGAESALESVYMGMIDPRELVWRWRRLLRTWKIHHQPGQVKYRVIMTRREFRLDGARGAGRLNRMMGALTLGPSERLGKDMRFQCCACEADGSSLPYQIGLEGREQWKIAPVGFWSFPIEALGEIGEGETLSDMDFEPDRALDMRSYWPELLVAKMA